MTQDDRPLAAHRIHLVGVGGSGMSGLARLLRASGADCHGTDAQESAVVDALRQHGVPVRTGESDGGIDDDREIVIHSAAIAPTHPEMITATDRGLETIGYAEALGRLQLDRTGISIAGTHGKSTTTALLAHVLVSCDLDPGVIVGATGPHLPGGFRVGAERVPGDGSFGRRPGLLVCEACEFNRSFHHHRPVLGLIHNVEEDHLDIYGSLDAIVESFHEFAKLLPAADEGGYLLIAHDGAHRRVITAGLDCAVETFGFSPAATWQVTLEGDGQVQLRRDGTTVARWRTPLPGDHNALNAAAAAILANRVGAPWSAIAPAIESFRGIDRRMQFLGTRRLGEGEWVRVYDDYGHHPTECEATIRALRAADQPKRVVCVFQPHQHSRTRFLLDEFATSFALADVVIVPSIHFVRDSEAERSRVSAGDLVDRLRSRGVAAMHVHPFEAIAESLESLCRDGDLVVVMGAGPVWRIARAFLDAESDHLASDADPAGATA